MGKFEMWLSRVKGILFTFLDLKTFCLDEKIQSDSDASGLAFVERVVLGPFYDLFDSIEKKINLPFLAFYSTAIF